MNRTGLLATAATAVTIATAVFAAEPLNIRPGYWNVTTTMTTGGAPLFVEGMPEAGKAEYAKSWARTVGKPTTENDEECITAKEVAETDLFKGMQDEAKSCKRTVVKQSSTAMVGSLECKDAKTTTKTEINYSVDSPTAFKGTLKSTMTSPNGVTTMTFAMSGKWTAASCPADEDEEDESADESGE